MAIEKAIGEALNLQAQLFDVDRSMPLRIFTDLIRANGSLIDTIELSYTSKGVFVNTSEIMPGEQTVLAKHYVFNDDGITLNDNYQVGEDRYDIKVSVSDIAINRVSVLEAEVELLNEIEIEIAPSEVIADFGASTDVEAFFYKDELEYFLDNNEYIGES